MQHYSMCSERENYPTASGDTYISYSSYYEITYFSGAANVVTNALNRRTHNACGKPRPPDQQIPASQHEDPPICATLNLTGHPRKVYRSNQII
jgi:hypothetical protein